MCVRTHVERMYRSTGAARQNSNRAKKCQYDFSIQRMPSKSVEPSTSRRDACRRRNADTAIALKSKSQLEPTVASDEEPCSAVLAQVATRSCADGWPGIRRSECGRTQVEADEEGSAVETPPP